jgi:hypothetical protein
MSRAVSVKGIYMALIQELWYREGCITNLNIPGYTLFSAGGTDRPCACILAGNETACMLPGFTSRDIVAVFIKYNKEGAEQRLVVCSAYLQYYSEGPPPSKKLEELVRCCEYENLYLVVGCDSNSHHSVWCGTERNSRGGACGISKFFKFGDLNRENERSSIDGKLDVIDITLEFLRFLVNIIDWEVSSELSLSDHRLILFTLRGS